MYFLLLYRGILQTPNFGHELCVPGGPLARYHFVKGFLDCMNVLFLRQLEMRSVVRGRYAVWSCFLFLLVQMALVALLLSWRESPLVWHTNLTFSSSAAWLDSSQLISAVSINVVMTALSCGWFEFTSSLCGRVLQ